VRWPTQPTPADCSLPRPIRGLGRPGRCVCPGLNRAGRVTLEDWAVEWQRSVVHLRPKTRRSYQSNQSNLRNHILPALGEYELAKLTPSMLRAWLSELTVKTGSGGKPLAPATVAQAYRTLNRVLGAAVDDELIGRNPVSSRPGAGQSDAIPDTPGAALLAEKTDERYRALVLVAGYGGLRAGELMALRRHHVDLLRRTISIVEQVQHVDGAHVVSAPKCAAGRRSVSIPRLVAYALDANLRSLRDRSSEALVFPAPAGGYLVAQNFRKRVWLPAVKAAGLAPLRLHDLRHTCASLAIAAGADVKVLQRMLGHASAAITPDRYGHLMPGQAESVAERLDQMARAAGTTPLASVQPLERAGTANT